MHDVRPELITWALAHGISEDALEKRNGELSWVLKPENRRLNLFDPDWWDLIIGKEHRWARALNSSQCFAVNLFAPLAQNPERARKFVATLLPHHDLKQEHTVTVKFEHTPSDAPQWLGERGQPTQIDVYFEITLRGRAIGHLLVEVKYTESGFGCCRGWKDASVGQTRNPEKSRCLDAASVLASPQTRCWLAQAEGRRYWELMAHEGSSIRLPAVARAGPCPFRHGLYQLMRNRVLADELKRRTAAEWADVALCRNARNSEVLRLDEAVNFEADALAAMRTLCPDDPIEHWTADKVVHAIGCTDSQLGHWRHWMLDRYFAE